MATLLSETFTGTNGDPWSTTNWTDMFGAADTIQSNRGRITTSGDALMWANDVVTGTNYDVRFSAIVADSCTAWCDFASEFNTGAVSGNGHEVELNQSANTVTIYTITGFVGGGSPVSTSYSWTSTDTIHVHIRVRGTACWVRVWKNAEDEPLTWQLTTTLTYTNTEVLLGANGAGPIVDFDNFLVVSDRLVTKTIDTGWAGSGDLIILSNSNPTWTGTVKSIIWKHGGLGGNAEEVDSWNLYLDIISDTNGKYVLYAADDGFGGNGAAGNSTEMGSLDAVYARAQTDEPDFPKVLLAGHSLGGMGIVNWTYRNLTKVAGMVGVDVILDAAQQNTNDGGSFVTNVLDPAYGGSGTWATNASTRDPEDLAAASSALRAIPFQIYDATGDSVLSSNVMSNYVTTAGAAATRTTVASGDHGTVHNFIDVPTLITFIEGLTFTSTDPAGTSAITLAKVTSSASGTVTNPALETDVDNWTSLIRFTGAQTASFPAYTTVIDAGAGIAITVGRAGAGYVIDRIATGPSPITGTSAATLAGLTSTASGTHQQNITGTSAATLAGLTSAGSGTHQQAVTGTSAATLGALTSSATGVEAFAATSAATLAGLTSTASGTESFTATSAATLGALTSTASGTLTITGTSAATLGALSSTASGTHTAAVDGTSAATLGALTSTASGTHTISVTGTSSATLGGLSSSGSGLHQENVTGTSAATLGGHTSSASGTLSITGTSAATLGAVTSTASGTETLTGTSARTLGGLTSTASGSLAIVGTSAATLGPLTSTGSGTHALTITGTSAATLGRLVSAAVGLNSSDQPDAAPATVRRRYAISNARSYAHDNRGTYRGDGRRTYRFKG